MREKLIELLKLSPNCICDLCGEKGRLDEVAEIIADNLIANGVTIPVRCKDCEKWQRHTQVDRERGHCRKFNITKHESGFCDRGERRTDGI